MVYAPVAHAVWGGGFLGTAGVLDFAGGTVVHINAGVAGLVLARYLAPQAGKPERVDVVFSANLTVWGERASEFEILPPEKLQ